MTVRRLSPIVGIRILGVAGLNGPGVAGLRVIDENTVAWRPPNGTEGAGVAIAQGETKICFGGGADRDKYARVYRSGAAALFGAETVQLLDTYNNVIGGSNFTSAQAAAGEKKVRGICFWEPGDLATASDVWLDPHGTRVTGGLTAFLGASGGGTIEKAGAFADWDPFGYVEMRDSGGVVRGRSFYRSRTDDALTIDAADRNAMATTTGAMSSNYIVSAIPPYQILNDASSNGGAPILASETDTPIVLISRTTPTSADDADAPTFLQMDVFSIFWIRRWVQAGHPALARVPVVLNYRFTIGGTTYYKQERGLFRVANNALDVVEILDGVNAEPAEGAAPSGSGATSPIVFALSAGNVHYLGANRRNRYNLVSIVDTFTRIDLTSAGIERRRPPLPPEEVKVLAGPDGKAIVTAAYFPHKEASTETSIDVYRATQWAVWHTTDGVAPDTSAAPTEVVAMTGALGPELLEYITDAALPGTVHKFVVKVRRVDTQGVTSITRSGATATVTCVGHGYADAAEVTIAGADQAEYNGAHTISLIDPNTFSYAVSGTPATPATGTITASPVNRDSEGETVLTLTATGCGPERPVGSMSFGKAAGLHQEPMTVDEVDVVDAGANIYWERKVGETLLWWDTVLIFRLRYRGDGASTNGFYTVFGIYQELVSGAAGEEPLEIVVAADEWYVTVNGVRRMKIDPTGGTIHFDGVDQLTAPEACCGEGPLEQRYGSTCFQVFDPVTQSWSTPVGLMGDGSLRMLVPWLQKATQAECLA